MFLGHIGAGLAAKSIAPRTSTAVLLGAPLLVDLVWPLFLLSGIEHAEPDPGNTAYTSIAFIDYPITHSLLTGIGWALAAGALYYAMTRARRGAIVVGGLVLSHWLFDWVVHRPDLPLYPGGPEYGMGLWNSIAGTVLVEAALLIGGIMLFLRATRAVDRQGVLSFWLLIALVVVVAFSTAAGPPPPTARDLAWFSFALWLIPLWGLWIDRHREPVL